MFVVTVLLLSVSEVISECPPSSGKTLDVYNNNCIGFIGIYLMHRKDCYLMDLILMMIMSTQKLLKDIYHVILSGTSVSWLKLLIILIILVYKSLTNEYLYHQCVPRSFFGSLYNNDHHL